MYDCILFTVSECCVIAKFPIGHNWKKLFYFVFDLFILVLIGKSVVIRIVIGISLVYS